MPLTVNRSTSAFALIAAFMIAVFLLGGSARDDVLSLIILRPLSVVALGLGLALMPREAWRENRLLIALACAFPLLALFHLLPLPPSIWRQLPGRELAWEVGETAGLVDPWRPISLVPFRTWNSFWSFFAPLAAMALALALPRDQARKLVFVIGLVILASGVLGLLQSIGGEGNNFYLYRITNEDSAVGLFANRNHQAMLLAIAFPVLAAAASLSKGARETVRPKLWLALGVGVMILPFLLVTGSRAGLVVGALGIVAALLVYRDPSAQLQVRRQAKKTYYAWAGVGVVAAALLLMTTILVRVSSLQRLFTASAADDLRLRVWGPINEAAWSYFPVGSGLGTFVEVYRTIEPDSNLSPRYLNHAHNDWLEILMTGGLPAVLIVVAAAILFVGAALRAVGRQPDARHSEIVIARLGLAIIVILAVGSVYDYPLRVPSLACLFAVAAVWLVRRRTA